MCDRLANIEQEIARLQQEKLKIEESLQKFENLPREYKLAIKLHERFCTWNHTDGCSWHYYVNEEGVPRNWNGATEQRYLNKAKELINKIDAVHKIHFPEHYAKISDTVIEEFLSVEI